VKITAITCTTPDRREAFELCKRYLYRQTRVPNQWLVLDGPEPMQMELKAAIEGGRITGDCVMWLEDDDYFKPGWIEWCVRHLERGYDMVGQGNAVYYSVSSRWWSKCGNVRHASLCQTAIRSKLLPQVWNIINDFNCPWIDVQLWNVECNKFLALPSETETLLVGIKGLCDGYSREHRQLGGDCNEPDYDLSKLREWIGDDAENYAKFWHGEDEILKLAGAL